MSQQALATLISDISLVIPLIGALISIFRAHSKIDDLKKQVNGSSAPPKLRTDEE